MECAIAQIGFGEAGLTFAVAGVWSGCARVYDIKTDRASERAAMLASYASAGVLGSETLGDAISDAPLVLSLVTADQALTVAEQAAPFLRPGAIYCDGNSIAPETKRMAAQAIEAAGADYIDVAVMAPVNPARLQVPLLLSGPAASRAGERLADLGFANVQIIGELVGRASAIKMIRSVMIKGIEALTAECVLAAARAGVLDEVLASLDASEKPRPWVDRADYNLDRMMVHGIRRAAEMEEVVKTLDGLGTGAMMSRGTVERQQAIGALGFKAPPAGLREKIRHINARSNDGAE